MAATGDITITGKVKITDTHGVTTEYPYSKTLSNGRFQIFDRAITASSTATIWDPVNDTTTALTEGPMEDSQFITCAFHILLPRTRQAI